MSKRPKPNDSSLSLSDSTKKPKTYGDSISNPLVVEEEQQSPRTYARIETSASPVQMNGEEADRNESSSTMDRDSTSMTDANHKKKTSKKRVGKTHEGTKHKWTDAVDTILISTVAGATKQNKQISWVHAFPAFQKAMKEKFDPRLTPTSLRKRFSALLKNHEMKNSYDLQEKGGILAQNLLLEQVQRKIKDAQMGRIEDSYEKIARCTSNETALALTSNDQNNKYLPQAIGTLDFFAINVRNLSIFYLDRYGLLDSSQMHQGSLQVLKGLGKIFALEPRLLATEGIDAGHVGTYASVLKSLGYEKPNQYFFEWFKKMCMDRFQNEDQVILPQETEFAVEPKEECFGSISLQDMVKMNSTPNIIGIKVEGSRFVGEFCPVRLEVVKTSEYGSIGTKTGTYNGFSDHQHKNCRILCEDKLIRKVDMNHYYVTSCHNKQFEKVSVDTMKKVWKEEFETNLESSSKGTIMYSSTVQDPGKFLRRAHIPFDLKPTNDKLLQQWMNAEKKLLELANPKAKLDEELILKYVSVLTGLWLADGSFQEPKFYLGKDEHQIFDWVFNVAKLLFPDIPCSRLHVFNKILYRGNNTKKEEDDHQVFQDHDDPQEQSSEELMNRYRSMLRQRSEHHNWYHFKKEQYDDILKHVIAIPYNSTEESNLLQHGYEPMMLVVWFQHPNWIQTMREIQTLVGTAKNYPQYFYLAPKTFCLGFLLGFTYGDGYKEKHKNVFSVSQKDIAALHLLRWYCSQQGMSSSSIYQSKQVFSFRFYGPGLVYFTDELFKKKSKDGDSSSIPRMLSLPYHYDHQLMEEKIKVSVLDPRVQFLVTARGAVYNVGKNTFIHYLHDCNDGKIIKHA
ncbi:hypothetical protein C9374_013821 [Naegleria lovaniensis]|uniref:Uncharacterized protein n=1 Tax=Naegleria lovaniensis TaxID=51637 RepID=A0AA88G921_NAELO|nr:uncharacterized protein C9374_013821 [Naegleria lovaniensis]KAG2370817.1 hypothetical protein C9374_013821 [Naegleria lovaniensis]